MQARRDQRRHAEHRPASTGLTRSPAARACSPELVAIVTSCGVAGSGMPSGPFPLPRCEVNRADREHAGPDRGRKDRRPGDERPVPPSQAEHDQGHRRSGDQRRREHPGDVVAAEPRDAGGACRGDCGERRPTSLRTGRPSGGSAQAASAAGTSQISPNTKRGSGAVRNHTTRIASEGTTTASIGLERAAPARVACRRGHEGRAPGRRGAGAAPPRRDRARAGRASRRGASATRRAQCRGLSPASAPRPRHHGSRT